MPTPIARTPVPIQRWPNKPTSGRFVYKGNISGLWFWQCDLHDDIPVPEDQWGEHQSQPEALAAALEHASQCPYTATPIGPPNA